jgi:hypothetical protein
MNTRIDIRIAIVGDSHSGRETFSKMLFLNNEPKMRIHPLSDLAEVYFEIDPLNFKHASKMILNECREHNTLIMNQQHITGTQDLRQKKIRPMFCKNVSRINGLINFEKDVNRLNKNILLTFYLIGNNYKEFESELNDSNIIIYLTDIFHNPADTVLFNYISKLVSDSAGRIYLLPVINKMDQATSMTCSEKHYESELMSSLDLSKIHTNMLAPLLLSAKYAYIIRKLMTGSTVITADEKQFLITNCGIKKDKIPRDLIRSSDKYLVDSGFDLFRECICNLLGTKYKIMTESNINRNLTSATEVFKDPQEFIQMLKEIKVKTDKLNQIFKKDYQSDLIDVVTRFLDHNKDSVDVDTTLCDCINEIIKDPALNMRLDAFKTEANTKIVKVMTQKLYANINSIEDLLPSKIHDILNKLINSHMPKDTVNDVAKHICLLYTTTLKTFIDIDKDQYIRRDGEIEALNSFFFDKKETTFLKKILDEVGRMMHYHEYKSFVIQLWLIKLRAVSKLIFLLNKIDGLLLYCHSVRYYLSENSNKKCEYLFQHIMNVCCMIIQTHSNPTGTLDLITENLDSILISKMDHMVDLDKFIVKHIKQTNYIATIAEDLRDSGDDSDIDIYGDGTDGTDGTDSQDEDDKLPTNLNNADSKFEFTPEELTEDLDSGDESVSPVIITKPILERKNSFRSSKKDEIEV